jgi:hypothetical protein
MNCVSAELLDVLEVVKGMEGSRDTIWCEIVQIVSKKKSIPSYEIDRL